MSHNNNEIVRGFFSELNTHSDNRHNNINVTSLSITEPVAALQIGQYADINSNDELLFGQVAPQQMRRSLEGIIAERHASVLQAAPQTENYVGVHGQITKFARNFFQTAAEYLKHEGTRNPTTEAVEGLVARDLLTVNPAQLEEMDDAMAAVQAGLTAHQGVDPLDTFRKQSLYFFNRYAALGRELVKVDSELKTHLAHFDSLEKQVAAIGLIKDDELAEAYSKYMKKQADATNIASTYKNYLSLLKEWAVMRELALLHRITANSEASSAPTCSVCMEDPITVALQPCGHCFCTSCKGQLGRNCPLCRRAITGSLRVYFN